jgi:NADH:ubiquinone oxidoreductase subunit 5 (subunit L)/multisubunit Na+/H+ antiporter MnhA subunit
MGLMSAFFGVVIGVAQDDAKTNLAYSSISQMGVMTIALGVGL